jgi:hypothetical protein
MRAAIGFQSVNRLNHDDVILTTEHSKTSTEHHDIKHQHEYCLVLLLKYCHLGSCTNFFFSKFQG